MRLKKPVIEAIRWNVEVSLARAEVEVGNAINALDVSTKVYNHYISKEKRALIAQLNSGEDGPWFDNSNLIPITMQLHEIEDSPSGIVNFNANNPNQYSTPHWLRYRRFAYTPEIEGYDQALPLFRQLKNAKRERCAVEVMLYELFDKCNSVGQVQTLWPGVTNYMDSADRNNYRQPKRVMFSKTIPTVLPEAKIALARLAILYPPDLDPKT